MAQKIKDLLPLILRHQDNWKLQLLSSWPTIFGSLSDKVSLEKVIEDTLVLGVQDSCWLQELHLLSAMLINSINESLGEPRIKNLRFKTVGNKKISTSPKQTKTHWAKKIVVLNIAEKKALSCIKDNQLADALKGFLVRCYQEK